MPNPTLKERIEKEFEEKFPSYKGVGAEFPLFAETPNRQHIENFILTLITEILSEKAERVGREENNNHTRTEQCPSWCPRCIEVGGFNEALKVAQGIITEGV